MRSLVPALCLLLLGCDDGAPATDGGADTDAGASGEVAPPSFGACPDGWSASERGCEPFVDAPLDCGPDEAQLPGASECAPIGECPSGPWPTDLPDGDRVYVSAGAGGGGDGSEGAPFATIRPALMRATPGTVIAVGEGVYDEAVVLNEGVALVGVCPARTRLHLTATAAASQTVAAVGADTLLRGVTVTGEAFAFVAQGAAASATLEQVVIRDFAGLALVVTEGATVTGRALSVVGPPGRHGAAEVDAGSTLTLERASIRSVSDAALLVYGAGARLVMSDAVIRDTHGDPDAIPAPAAVGLDDGATAELRRVAIHTVAGFGVYATNRASAQIEDTVVEETAGVGLNFWLGSALDARRSRVVGAGDVGVHVRESDATLEDVAIEGSRARGPTGRGTGLIAFRANVGLSRVRVADSESHGVVLTQASTLGATDLTIEATRSDPDTGEYGRGLSILRTSTATVERGLVVGNRDVGILSALDGASARLTGVTVSGTREAACVSTSCPTSAGGMGVTVLDTGDLTATDLTVSGNAFVGIHGLAGGRVDVTRGVVEGHPIGLNIQGESVDPATDLREVEFLDNERNVARDTVAAPAIREVFEL